LCGDGRCLFGVVGANSNRTTLTLASPTSIHTHVLSGGEYITHLSSTNSLRLSRCIIITTLFCGKSDERTDGWDAVV
jgi:hypothetical protein